MYNSLIIYQDIAGRDETFSIYSDLVSGKDKIVLTEFVNMWRFKNILIVFSGLKIISYVINQCQ